MEDRKDIIREKILEEEQLEMIKLSGIRQKVFEILTLDKKYHPKEIGIDPIFKLILSDCEANVSIDFIINLEGLSFMIIRCAQASLESWERYVTAFARAVKDYQIPYAVITDGEMAITIDVINGNISHKRVSELFTRQDALKIIKDFQKTSCPPKRLEKEKRIIYAFEGIKCPTDTH